MFITLLMAFLIILLFYILQQTSGKRPPGPFSWPIVGNLFLLRRLTREFGGQHHAFIELSKRYNSNVISLQLGPNNLVIVSDSNLAMEILHKDAYDGRPWNEFMKMRNMGMKKGLTINDGPDYKELRAWTVRTLRTVGFAKKEMVDRLMDELASILDKLKGGGVQHVRNSFNMCVINVLWALVTGKKASESPRLPYFIELLDRRSAAFDMAGGTISVFPWLQKIAPNFTGYNTLKLINDDLKVFLMGIINDHKRRYVKGKEMDLIDMFLREMYSQHRSNVFTDDNLFILLIDFFLAGISNTTSTVDILLLQMANHQDVQKKLHEEIDAVIGRDKIPELSDRPKMLYTEAVLTESQRIWAVTPLIGPRRVLYDTTLAGYSLPKDTTVLINIYRHNTATDLFPDSTTFKPERYFKNGVYEPNEHIILFGKGRRRCPGEALAKSAVFLLFVGIMQKYKMMPPPGEERINFEMTSGLTIAPKPYKTLVVPR